MTLSHGHLCEIKTDYENDDNNDNNAAAAVLLMMMIMKAEKLE